MHILWIKTELLHPVDKGGRIRTYNMLRELKRANDVTYLTLDDGAAAPDALERASEYATRVETVRFDPAARRSPRFYGELVGNLLSPLPYAVARWRSPEMTRRLLRLVSETRPDVVVCDFLFPSLNVPTPLGAPTVLFQHNVEAVIWRRHADVASNPLARFYFTEQWRRMRRFEAKECLRYDHVVAVSDEDARAFAEEYGTPSVSSVPTGVDTDYFRRSGREALAPNELVFVGSMDWMPNEDGVTWFVDAVLPLIRARVPDVVTTVVGRNPPGHIRALAERDPSVRVTGTVPDVRPYLERAALSVVPLRVGGGTRLKIYEAMSIETPVVSTAIGAEGLPVRGGEHIAIADAPQDFADSVVSLLGDAPRGARMAASAVDLVRRRFSWASVADQFADTCREVAERRQARTPEAARR